MSSPTDQKKGIIVLSPDVRAQVRKKSDDLYHKNVKIREMKKIELYETRKETEQTIQAGRDMMLKRWKKKTSKSPFAVGLLAEDERIVEENKIRHREDKARGNILKMQRENAYGELVLAVRNRSIE